LAKSGIGNIPRLRQLSLETKLRALHLENVGVIFLALDVLMFAHTLVQQNLLTYL